MTPTIEWVTIDPDAQALYDNDPSAPFLGIALLEASPERSVVQMAVTEAMCNGYGIGHGGMTFLLADSAMAFASNSGLRDTGGGRALATSADIDWLAPVKVGDTLTATCELRHGPGRSKVWRIDVTNQDGDTVATLTGRTRRLSA